MSNRSSKNPTAEKCNVPPPGWECSREAGHNGPCAASPTDGDVLVYSRKDAEALVALAIAGQGKATELEAKSSKNQLAEADAKELMRRIMAAGVCSDTYRYKIIRDWYAALPADETKAVDVPDHQHEFQRVVASSDPGRVGKLMCVCGAVPRKPAL